MEQTAQTTPLKFRSRVEVIVIIACLCDALLWFALGLLDDFTEITPVVQNGAAICWTAAFLAGAAAGAWALRLSADLSPRQRIGALLGGCVLAFIMVLAPGLRLCDLIQGAIDFPAGKTHTFNTLLPIARAYQTHGKNHGWDIQTTPIWSNLDITEDDYDFMTANRRPGDSGANPDEIASDGFFCARVTMQQSGQALRILHAGAHKLPPGTVIRCPASLAQPSSH